MRSLPLGFSGTGMTPFGPDKGCRHACSGNCYACSGVPGGHADRHAGGKFDCCFRAVALVAGQGVDPGDGVAVVRGDAGMGMALAVIGIVNGVIGHQGLHAPRVNLVGAIGHFTVDQEAP